MNKKLKIYLAAGWFTPRTREILDNIENILTNREDIDLYSPRRDGKMLPPNQKHDTALRESIFKENISNILKADLVFANIDSVDSYNDPGTIYEVGYAMANNVPVVGFTVSEDNIPDRFSGILKGFEHVIFSYEAINDFMESYKQKVAAAAYVLGEPPKKKLLFVGAGDTKVDSNIASIIMDSGYSIRWVNEIHKEVYSRVDEIFEDVEFVVAVVDDRKTMVSWMIGQAYARKIPIITYSDFNYGINVMLLVSILTHIRGTDELTKFLQQVKREGLESIPKFDISELDSM